VVDLGGEQEAALVVVAQRADGQADGASEGPDGERRW
jgi:hypothetical protein